jgi:hypothetical protein
VALAGLHVVDGGGQHIARVRAFVAEELKKLDRAAPFEERLLQEFDRAATAHASSELVARLYELSAALSRAATHEGVANAVLTQGVAALGASGGGVPVAADAERLYGQRLEFSRRLQRSLPPRRLTGPPGIDIAGVYHSRGRRRFKPGSSEPQPACKRRRREREGDRRQFAPRRHAVISMQTQLPDLPPAPLCGQAELEHLFATLSNPSPAAAA